MKSKTLAQAGQKTYALIFDKGDEFISCLTSFVEKNRLGGSHFTAIGAFSDVTLGYFDRAATTYKKIPIKEQVEALSLVGDIALKGDSPQVHPHLVVGKADGTAHGGHVLEAHVRPTLEVILCRKIDPETGLTLIDLVGNDGAVNQDRSIE